jgi:hypothetical protein
MTFRTYWYNVVNVKSCFVSLVESNAKQSNVKPYALCMVCVTISCIRNWILVIMWEGLLPIYIFVFFFSIGVHFLLIIGDCL